MWSVLVVVVLPCFDFRPSLGECREQGLVQAFISKAPVEALYQGILGWFSRCDVVPVDACVLTPVQHSRTGELDLSP